MAIARITCLCLALIAAPLASEQPPAEPWNTLKNQNILTWSQSQMRQGFPNIDQVKPVRFIPASNAPMPLPEAPWPGTDEWATRMADLNLAGLLVIENGTVRYEHYRQGHKASQPWMSFSVTKSVVSMLFGAALKDGDIRSLDDMVSDYVPEFHNSAYASVTIEDLLRMRSGVAWSEAYDDPASDVSRLDNARESEILRHLASLPRAAPPGATFNYNTGETILAGVILSRAVGTSLSAYLANKIWVANGMASEANWALMGAGGGEMGGCCISATLKDYGRLGMLALDNWLGNDSPSELPAGWLRASTTPASDAPNYGFFWWLGDGNEFRASGIFGQAIHVLPDHRLVIAMHGLWPSAVDEDLSSKREALIDAIKDRASSARQADLH